MNKPLTLGPLLVLVLAACATPPTTTTRETSAAPAEKTSVTACLVADPANASVNAEITTGLEKAAKELGATTHVNQIAAADDYVAALQGAVDQGCTVVLATGSSSADPVMAAAKTNPSVGFALVDTLPNVDASNPLPSNLRPVLFNTNESSFLAGYAAAASSAKGTVGVFGAIRVPAVTIYLDGFVQGVEHYNQAKGKSVKVNGWDRERLAGTFVASTTDPWNDPPAGAKAAASLDADVVMAVARDSGTGALENAKSDGTKVIWSDVDGCQTNADACEQILGSVIKDRAAAVFEFVSAASRNRSASGVFVGNVRNGGTRLVGLSDDALTAEIEDLSAQIADGRIRVTSDSAVN